MLLGTGCVMGAPAQAQVQPAGTNDFGGFRNILPAGQGRTVTAAEVGANQASGAKPDVFTNQLGMYTGLVGAAPRLRAADLNRFFKPAGFGVPPALVGATVSPRAGVTIVRDKPYGVPHVYGTTRADTMFGAGYASAQDRLFLMDVLRHTGRARLTELIGPGEGDSTVRMDAEQLLIADYSEEELQGMIDNSARAAGAEGQTVKQDLLAYVDGINAYIREARTDPNKLPGEYPALGKTPRDWKPTDTVAIASLIGGIFGRGGGVEAAASQALREAEKRFGVRRGRRVFNDFRAINDPEAPVTTRQRFAFDNPGRPSSRALAVPDLGSVNERNPVVSGSSAPTGGTAPGGLDQVIGGLPLPSQQSNALLVARNRSRSGRALAVMGPQVGYYSPQILMEIDLHGPGIDARGAAFPGISLYVLLGRGRDFAWSATTATTDVVDEFTERLCEPNGSAPTLQSNHYLYKGRCRPFLTRDHVLQTTPNPTEPTKPPRTIRLKVERSVHGPIQARARVRGVPVAISEARSTYFHELESALAFKRLNFNQVTGPRSFQQTMSKINFAFNWFYADDRNIAYLQSGWYPRRARGTDPTLPAWGTGEWDWRGFNEATYNSLRMPFRSLPKAINPKQGYLVSWNNKQAPGWRAADDVWSYGSVHRSERLEDRVRFGLRRGRKLDLVGLTRIMATAATVDLRGQELYPLMRRVIGQTRDREASAALGLMDAWSRAGSHRRDLNGDNVLEHSGAIALMDQWWPRIVRHTFQPVIGRNMFLRIQAINETGSPPDDGGSAFFSGWWGYVEKDLRATLGRRVRGGLSRRYCGRGSRTRCRALLLATLRDAMSGIRQAHGTNPSGVRRPATCEENGEAGSGIPPRPCDQIRFVTGGAIAQDPIPWQDRPTFQQVVEVRGHRAQRR